MRKLLLILSVFMFNGMVAAAQTKPAATASPSPAPQTQTQPRPSSAFELSDYGVSFTADPRLIVVMAALDAAGFDPTPGREPSVFRARVRQDQAGLDGDLRLRLKGFYERNKLPAPATPADQAARYVSLAYALGAPPGFEAPDRNEDLPGGVLEVLDFAPLVREFYRRSGIDDRLVSYTRAYQAEGDRLRKPTAEMVRSVLSYLHTRPILVTTERVIVHSQTTKKKSSGLRSYSVREHERNFFIVPDLLAAPGAINLRGIADDYFAILPEGTDPTSSELRRGYLQFVIDPLMLRFNKEIAERREPLKQLLKEREGAGSTVTPDVFLAVSRSLVAAVDARYNELLKVQTIATSARARLAQTKDADARAAIGKEAQAAIAAAADNAVAQLADDYEHGSVLDFYFVDQLKGIEQSGFDIANFFPDMIASFDATREAKRPAEYAEARARSEAARQARMARRNDPEPAPYTAAEAAKAAGLVKTLADVEAVLQQKDYHEAERRLRELIKDYPREPRVFFALAQTASVAAADATDEDIQAQRLNNALSNYRLAVAAASPETDRALLSRAHEAMGRIYAFMEKRDEASKEFDEAIKIGDVPGGAHAQAVEGKKKLTPP